MLGLPKGTEMCRQLPKKNIYANYQLNTVAKEKIDADISKITIVNEITPNNVNISAGNEVKSFFVLYVALKRKDFDKKIVETLSKLIPQNILFVLEYVEESKLAVFHKKVMLTEWKPTDEQSIELKGLNFDKVWENIVISVSGIEIENGNSLDEQIEINEKRLKMKKEIAKLEKLARAEKQPKKKFEYVQKINQLKQVMEE